MVISFSVSEARNQLLENGTVYTFRWTRRKKTGKDWANLKRGTKKIADVYIEEIGLIPPHTVDLFPYYKKSGFKSTKEWIKVIMEMANPHGYINGYLYKVSNCDTCGWYHPTQDRCCYLDNQCEWGSTESQQIRTEES